MATALVDISTSAARPKGRRLYLRLLREALVQWRILAIAFVAMVLVAAAEVSIPIVLKHVVWGFETSDLGHTPLLAGALVLVFLVRGAATFSSATALAHVGGRLAMDLRVRMFARLMDVPIAFHDRHNSGSLSSKLTYDAAQVMQAATNAAFILVRDTLTILGLVAWMIYLNWQLTLIALAAAPPVSLVVLYLAARLRRMSWLLQETMGEVTHASLEGIEGQKIIRSHGTQDYERRRFGAIANRARRFQVKFLSATAANAPVAQFITACALAAILIVAARQFEADRITLAEFMSFFTAMGMLFPPLKRLTNINGQLQNGIAAAESVYGLIDEESESGARGREIGQVEGRVEYRGVSFRYPREREGSLHDVNLVIEPGETVALVGASGAGKSTLASLLLRFYEPDSGAILLDGNDVRELNAASLRRQIAFVGQDVILFNDTVAANIAYGEGEPDRAALIDAARNAHALSFIESLPGGFDARVGERGGLLSGGQRQRLAIARAFYRNAPMLVLDEATSALDTSTEQSVQMAIERLRAQRTTLVIAHRLSTVRNADRIAVLDHGRLIDTGPHEALIARCPVYAELTRRQLAPSGDAAPAVPGTA